jgi:outer membrane protein insertion porin family
MQSTSWRLLIAAVVALACVQASAQKFIPKTIQFKGAPEYSEQELLAAAELKKGIALTAAEMNDHSKLLMDSGVFDGITYKFDGVDLIYQMTVAPQLYPIHLANLPIEAGGALDAKIHEKLPLYHGKVPAEGTLLQGVIVLLEQSLEAHGIHAKVTATPGGVPGSRQVTSMDFSILAPPVKVGAVDLHGASTDMQAKMRPVLRHVTGSAFDTAQSRDNVERAISSFYSDEGYAAVKVHAERTGDPAVGDASIDIPYSVTVEEGKIYKLGTITLPADALVTEADVSKLAATLPQGMNQGVQVRSTWQMISTRYKSKGYLDCKMDAHPGFDDAQGVVNYKVEIQPGPVYHLAFVKFDNVGDPMRALLMKNWQMMPGDPFDLTYVSNFIAKVQEQDPVLRRSLAGVKSKYDVTADPQTHDVNVVLRLEKQ